MKPALPRLPPHMATRSPLRAVHTVKNSFSCMPDVWLCQKLAHVSQGEGRLTTDRRTPLDYIVTTQGNWWCLSTTDTFLGYDVAVPVWSTDYTTVALETSIICAMFLVFQSTCNLALGHFLLQRPLSRASEGYFMAFCHPQISSIAGHWEQVFWFYHPHFLLVLHTWVR